MPRMAGCPAAMIAPTPVSALLHAVAVVKTGVFAVLRIIGFVFGPKLLADIGTADILAWFAAGVIIISSLIAIQQDNLKRQAGFSTIGAAFLYRFRRGAAVAAQYQRRVSASGGPCGHEDHALYVCRCYYCQDAPQ